MGYVLALDAATYTGSVALFDGDRLLNVATASMRGEKEERLMPAVAALLQEHGVNARALERIVCGAGPGSFTSLRIAVSIAKGLAFAGGGALESVSSLALIVAGAEPSLPPGRYVATLDAMRGDRFAAPYQVDSSGLLLLGEPWLAPQAEVAMRAHSLGATLIGPGASIDALPHARGVRALQGTPHVQTVDLARWEPLYGRLAEAQVRWEREHGRALESAHGRA
jgi:tRNA threonylcarbamoyladenosine biosynthesis protein TsaB